MTIDVKPPPHDRQLAQLVYDLYGLTEEEIKIVEELDR